MENIGDSIAWPARDPQWLQKVLIIGLISLIPIVGQMNAYGWMLGALDNLRAGRQELPPAGFQHLGRGVNLYVVLLVWGLLVAAIIIVLFILAATFSGIGSSQSSAGAGAAGALFFLLAWLVTIVASLGLYVLHPPLIVATERGGIGGGLDFPDVLAIAAGNASQTLVAGLMVLVAYLIGSLGVILCFIGAIVTQPYAYAVMAGIVSHYERAIGAWPSQPPMAPAT